LRIGLPDHVKTPRVHQAKQYRSPIPGVEARGLTSNHHFPRHAHDQFGIGVISLGAHRSWSGIGQVEAFAGDVIMVNPGEIHDGTPVNNSARTWRMIYIDPALVRAVIADEFNRQVEIVRPVAKDARLAKQFTRLFACLTTPAADRLAVDENLLSSLIHVVREHGTERLRSSGLSPNVAKALERLNSAPEMPVSLDELAALSGVNRYQFLRGFAREVGITPHAYLIQRRVLLTRKLLTAGRTPAESAIAAGFADQSHMTRAFVRHFGVTPARYQAAIS